MDKPKTLDELDNMIWVNGEAQNAIRDEAIKWLKQDNIQELFLSGRIDILPSYTRMIGQGMRKWIKHFFNITEEELL